MDLHPSVDLDRFSRCEIQMVLDHGDVMQQHGKAAQLVYGYLSVIVAGEKILSVYERDRINDVEFLTYDELEKHPHFDARLDERDLYYGEVQDIVDNGVFYYNQYCWFYLGEISGEIVKVVRHGNQLKSVYWLKDNPRAGIEMDSVTETYLERRDARKYPQESVQS